MSARILVIEDNPTNLELMLYLLRAFGFEPAAARDGEEGLEAAARMWPDLILCDVQLPGIGGVEVVRRLKRDTGLADVPVVAVTALAMVGDRDRLLAAGFDGYISKPIDPQTFVPQIAGFLKLPVPELRRMASPVAAGLSETPLPAARARALLLDDSPSNRDLMKSLLEPNGIALTAVTSIKDALAHLDLQKPDLIISDLHVGREHGLEFFKQVKLRPELKAVPFIFISSTVFQLRDRLRALSCGADRFITRPIEPQALLAEVWAVLTESGKG